jgi:anaerobic magnesium-protoporphyrin IX monomethyl ester cyclase
VRSTLACVRVALVYPEVYDLARFKECRKEFPPFGPLYLAAAAEARGHEVAIFKVSPGAETLDLRDFAAVGYSVSASATFDVLRRARMTSRHARDALIMAGGVHANLYPEQTLRELQVDVVGIGDGEETFVQLLHEAETRRFERVAGVCFLRGDEFVRTAERDVPRDIDHLPLPARHLLPAEDLVMTDRLSSTDIRMAHVMFSRGCPYRCRFCAVAGSAMQYRSGASARRELEQLVERYDVGGFAVVDDNFIIHRRKVLEICHAIEDLKLRWSALSRVNTVRPDLLAALRRAGCIELKFGMESGSPKILAAMRKNIRPEQIRRAVLEARAADINVKLFLIHGFPGEDLSTTRETIRLLEELAPAVERVSLFRFVPLPGTEVYRNPERYGIRTTHEQPGWNGDWSRFHIHHNTRHWWGDGRDFAQVEAGYRELAAVVDELWPEPHAGSLHAPAAA